MDKKFHNELHREDLERLIEKTKCCVRNYAIKLSKSTEEFLLANTGLNIATNVSVKIAYGRFDIEMCKLCNYLRMYKRLYGVDYKD